MMIYVADTHSLIWFLTEDNKLSDSAKNIFELVERGTCLVIVPTIVLLEVLHICEKKKISNEFSEVIERLNEGINYVFYNLDMDIIVECGYLIKIHDMHDRVISATARLLNAFVITKDSEIIESDYVKTVW